MFMQKILCFFRGHYWKVEKISAYDNTIGMEKVCLVCHKKDLDLIAKDR